MESRRPNEPLHTCKPHAAWLEKAIWAIAYDDARKFERALMKDERNRDGELEIDPAKIETRVQHVGMFNHVLIQKFFGGDPYWSKDFEEEREEKDKKGKKVKTTVVVSRYGRRGFRMEDGPLEKHEIGDSCLHLCAKNGKPECMRLLLRLGAKQDVFNAVGRTARQCAEKGGVCASIFAEEARRKREEARKAKLDEMAEAGISHIPVAKKSDELLDAEEHQFESLELGEHIQIDYTDNPDQKATEHVYYFLRKMDVILPEKVNIVLAFGCEDHRVAERCYELYQDGHASKILLAGGLEQDPERQMPVADRLKIHLVAKGVPADVVLTETDCTDIASAARRMVRTLQSDDPDFECPRYDALVVAAPYQQRRAWLTCQKLMPDWVWLHNAPIHSTEIDHGTEIDTSWRVDEAYYKEHYGRNTRELCLEEMAELEKYEALGHCAVDPSPQHADIQKDHAILKARVVILGHFEEQAYMAKRKQMFASA